MHQPEKIAELRALAREAQGYQLERGWSDAQICREISHLGHSKTYKRILDEADPLDDLNVDNQLRNYRAAVELISIRRSSERPAEPEYDDFTNVTAALSAVAGALSSTGIDRLVIIQGETGTGKDTAKRALLKRWPKLIVECEADELWRESLNTPLGEMIRALGIRRVNENGEPFKMPMMPSQRQELVIEELNKRKLVLVINEAHRMGPRALNLITTIINKTQCVVVMLCIPALITRLVKDAYEEAIQLIGNRLSEGVTLPNPPASEIGEMFDRRELQFVDDRTKAQAATALSKEAKSYGNWAFVKQVIRILCSRRDKVTMERFAESLATARSKRFVAEQRRTA